MNEIRSLLRVAARRLEVTSFLAKGHVITIVAAAVIIGLLIAERLGAEAFVPWRWVLPALVGLAALGSLRWWLRSRRNEVQVAVEVDERLDLREKLSTALHVRDRQDPFARAAVEDAVSSARDPRVREHLRRRFAVVSPRRWWLSPMAIALAVGLSFVPPLDLFSSEAEADDAVVEAIRDRDNAIDAVIEPIKESPELREELADMLGELSKEGSDADALKNKEEIKRDAVKKLTDLNRRLDEIINGPKGKTAEAIEKALEQLKTPEEGAAKELAEAMANADFNAAKKALEELQAKLESGELTEAQKKQLAQQLKDLAAQLEQLAKQTKQLEDLLKQAGMDPQLAKNPQALQQALQNNPNLNQQQMQQLMQMAQAQQAAGQMCQSMGGAMGQMAQQLQQGQMGQFGQLGDQLSQLEAMQQLMVQAQAAANACQGQCNGIGQGLQMQQALQQWAQGRMGAFGGRGQGAGGQAPISPTPSRTSPDKAPTKTVPGDIIARQFIEGPQIVGESKGELRQVAAAIEEGYDEALGEDQLHRKYHEAQKHYFGELKERVDVVVRPDDDDEPDSDTDE
jgi:hypothetical protein